MVICSRSDEIFHHYQLNYSSPYIVMDGQQLTLSGEVLVRARVFFLYHISLHIFGI